MTADQLLEEVARAIDPEAFSASFERMMAPNTVKNRRNRAMRKARAALAVVLEACAQVAKEHKGAGKRKRAENINLAKIMRFASDEAKAEIFAEERGEDIAAEIIERNIRALKPKD